MTKVFTEKVSREVTFSEQKDFEKNKNVKISPLPFSKTLCHRARGPKVLKGHRGLSDLLN